MGQSYSVPNYFSSLKSPDLLNNSIKPYQNKVKYDFRIFVYKKLNTAHCNISKAQNCNKPLITLKLLFEANTEKNVAVELNNYSAYEAKELKKSANLINEMIIKILDKESQNIYTKTQEKSKTDIKQTIENKHKIRTLLEACRELGMLENLDGNTYKHLRNTEYLLSILDNRIKIAESNLKKVINKSIESAIIIFKSKNRDAKNCSKTKVINIKTNIYITLRNKLCDPYILSNLYTRDKKYLDKVSEVIAHYISENFFRLNKSIFPGYNNHIRINKNLRVSPYLLSKIVDSSKEDNKKSDLSSKLESKSNIKIKL